MRFKSIKTEIVYHQLATLVLGLGVVTGLAVWTAGDAQRDRISRDLTNLAANTASAIDGFLNERRNEILTIAQAESGRSESLADIAGRLGQYAAQNRDIHALELLDGSERNQVGIDPDLLAQALAAQPGETFLTDIKHQNGATRLHLLTPLPLAGNQPPIALCSTIDLEFIRERVRQADRRTIGEKHA